MLLKGKIELKIHVHDEYPKLCSKDCHYFVDISVGSAPWRTCKLFDAELRGEDRCEKCLKAFLSD